VTETPAARIRVLGPFRLDTPAGELAVPAPKARAVLALLTLHAGSPVPISLLVRRLWAGRPPSSATAAVRNHVVALRKLLRAVPDLRIDTVGADYVLRTRPAAVDLAEVRVLQRRALAARGRGDTTEAHALLADALGRFRGPVLAELQEAGHDWPEIAEAERLRVRLLESRIAVAFEAGRTRDVLPVLERLVREHPAHEGFHRARMAALAADGRTGHGVAAFHEARAHLVARGRGIGPGLVKAHDALLRPVALPARESAEPAIRPVAVLAARLPDRGAAEGAAAVVTATGGLRIDHPGAVLLAVFRHAGEECGADRALHAAMVVRRGARGAAVVVGSGHLLLPDTLPPRVDPRGDDLLARCLRLLAATPAGRIQVR
jgi:SARP family transcriptional regulator, regulator of embCAB operon